METEAAAEGFPPTKPLVLSPAEISAKATSTFPPPGHGDVSWRTLLSAPATSTDSLTAGIATCPPRTGNLAHHRHAHAELYYVISGSGIVTIDGVERDVEAGSVVFIPGDAEHAVRNEGAKDFVWLYCFAADGFENVAYRFSGEEPEVGGEDGAVDREKVEVNEGEVVADTGKVGVGGKRGVAKAEEDGESEARPPVKKRKLSLD